MVTSSNLFNLSPESLFSLTIAGNSEEIDLQLSGPDLLPCFIFIFYCIRFVVFYYIAVSFVFRVN